MTNCLLIPDELQHTFENLGTGTKLTAGWCEEGEGPKYQAVSTTNNRNCQNQNFSVSTAISTSKTYSVNN